MKLFSYLDTNNVSIERLTEGRKHINIVAFLSLIMGVIYLFTALVFFIFGFYFTGLFFICFTLCFFVLGGWCVIKREIYGIMLFLKNKE